MVSLSFCLWISFKERKWASVAAKLSSAFCVLFVCLRVHNVKDTYCAELVKWFNPQVSEAAQTPLMTMNPARTLLCLPLCFPAVWFKKKKRKKKDKSERTPLSFFLKIENILRSLQKISHRCTNIITFFVGAYIDPTDDLFFESAAPGHFQIHLIVNNGILQWISTLH